MIPQGTGVLGSAVRCPGCPARNQLANDAHKQPSPGAGFTDIPLRIRCLAREMRECKRLSSQYVEFPTRRGGCHRVKRTFLACCL